MRTILHFVLCLMVVTLLSSSAVAVPIVTCSSGHADYDATKHSLVWGVAGECWDKGWLLDYSYNGYRMGQQSFGADWVVDSDTDDTKIYDVTTWPSANSGTDATKDSPFRDDDDWFGIQRAIDGARDRDAGGTRGIVQIPAGTYDVSSALLLHDKTPSTAAYVTYVLIRGECDGNGNPLSILNFYVPQSTAWDQDNDNRIESDNQSMCDEDTTSPDAPFKTCTIDDDCNAGTCGIDERAYGASGDPQRCHNDRDTTSSNTNGDFCTADGDCGTAGYCAPGNGFDGIGQTTAGDYTWNQRRGSAISLNLIHENEEDWGAGALKQIGAETNGVSMVRGTNRLHVLTGDADNLAANFGVDTIIELRITDDTTLCNGGSPCTLAGYCVETCDILAGNCTVTTGRSCSANKTCQPQLFGTFDALNTCNDNRGTQANCAADFICKDAYDEGGLTQYLANWDRPANGVGKFTDGQVLYNGFHRITALSGAAPFSWFDIEPGLPIDIRARWADDTTITRVATVVDDPPSWTYDTNLLTTYEVGLECLVLKFPIYPYSGHHNNVDDYSFFCDDVVDTKNTPCVNDAGCTGTCGSSHANGGAQQQADDENSKGTSFFFAHNIWMENLTFQNLHGSGMTFRQMSHITMENILSEADMTTLTCDNTPEVCTEGDKASVCGASVTQGPWSVEQNGYDSVCLGHVSLGTATCVASACTGMWAGAPARSCSVDADCFRNHNVWGSDAFRDKQVPAQGPRWEMAHHLVRNQRVSRMLFKDSNTTEVTIEDYSETNFSHYNAVVNYTSQMGHYDLHHEGNWSTLITGSDFLDAHLHGGDPQDKEDGILMSSGFANQDISFFGNTWWGIKTNGLMPDYKKTPYPSSHIVGVDIVAPPHESDRNNEFPLTSPIGANNVRDNHLMEAVDIDYDALEPKNIWQAQYIENFCADNVVQFYEACDDGNRVGGDSCSANCLAILATTDNVGFSLSGGSIQ